MTVFVVFYPHSEPGTTPDPTQVIKIRFRSPARAYQWLTTGWVGDSQVTATWDGEEISTDELRQCVEWFRRTLEPPES